jgi:dienelactone hydrolase
VTVRGWVQGASELLGVSLAVLVGRQGSWAWQSLRVVVVGLLTLGVVRLVRRAADAVVGAVALALGVLGTVAGVGIGVVHLAKAGLVLSSAAGLAALASGLMLLVLGGWQLTRLLPGWWRLAALPAAFLLFQFVLVPVTPAVAGTNPAPTEVGDRTPAYLDLPFAEAAFTTADGVPLSGWYIPSTNGAAVAVLHGSGSTRSGVLDQAAVLARHGYGVLLYDDRGHGRSGGAGMDFGWWGDLDVAAAVSYLESRPDVEPGRIGVLGLSMGGEQAINAAATDSRIRAVVAEGVQPKLPADTPQRPPGLEGLTERAVDVIGFATARLLTRAPTPLPQREAVAAVAPRPLLLIAGEGEVPAARALQAVAPSTVSLWELPDTPHTAGLAQHRDAWTARVTAFFDTNLSG